MGSSLTQRLARHLDRAVSPDDEARAALHLLDWAGCAAAGRVTPAGTALAAVARAIGTGRATAIDAPGLSPAAAAFLNGGLGNVLEMDDIHRSSILHPGPVVIPAALAAAEARGADGRTLLRALVRGYEAVIRIGAAVGPAHYALWHNTSTCGPFGAAAAAAALMDLSREQTVWALGNAGTQASGPWQCRHEQVMTKQLHTARAAQSGLLAAELAGQGFSGPAFILEGPQGVFAAMAPDGNPDAVMAEADVAQPGWKIWDTSFKPWPACRHAHPTIDAALALRDRGIEVGAVARIEIETYADAIRFCDRPDPRDEMQAKFSLQHAAANALAEGPPGLDAFGPEAVARSAALRARCQVAAGTRWSEAFPSRYGAAVAVTLHDGTQHRAEMPDALGDPENPVPPDAIAAKARALCLSAGWSDTDTARLIGAAMALPQGGPLSAFTDALCPHRAASEAAE
ncbi:MAG: MmgE/PrpD family protein [Pseudomonadota bacterium]